MSQPQEHQRRAGWPTTVIVSNNAETAAGDGAPTPRADGKKTPAELGAEKVARKAAKAAAKKAAAKSPPTMGWPAFWYKVAWHLGIPWVPTVGANERQLNEDRLTEISRYRARMDSVAAMRRSAIQAPRGTVVFINAKGAAATTATTVWTATTMAEATRRSLIVLDANPASGTSAARLGLDAGETITIQELSDSLAEMAKSFARFISRVTPSRYSVRSISANSIIEGGRQVTADRYAVVLEVIQENCEYLFVDTANNIVDQATLEVVAVADVLVFTANVAVHDSLRQLATSMETLRRQGYRELVDNAVVVISNLPQGALLDDYRKFLNRTNLRDEVIANYDFHGPFMAVPHDPYIARDSIVDLSAISWPAQQAYRELAVVILEQAARQSGQPNPADAASDS